jgi:cystathionine beta-lyase/cystathionine gamma-synthase
VVYSATKHIDGQGRCLGGAILGSEKFIQDNIHQLIRQTGPSLSPFNAWVLLKGLETLAVRTDGRRSSAAMASSADVRRSNASPEMQRQLSPAADEPSHMPRQLCAKSSCEQCSKRQAHSGADSQTRRHSFSHGVVKTAWPPPT